MIWWLLAGIGLWTFLIGILRLVSAGGRDADDMAAAEHEPPHDPEHAARLHQ